MPSELIVWFSVQDIISCMSLGERIIGSFCTINILSAADSLWCLGYLGCDTAAALQVTAGQKCGLCAVASSLLWSPVHPGCGGENVAGSCLRVPWWTSDTRDRCLYCLWGEVAPALGENEIRGGMAEASRLFICTCVHLPSSAKPPFSCTFPELSTEMAILTSSSSSTATEHPSFPSFPSLGLPASLPSWRLLLCLLPWHLYPTRMCKCSRRLSPPPR